MGNMNACGWVLLCNSRFVSDVLCGTAGDLETNRSKYCLDFIRFLTELVVKSPNWLFNSTILKDLHSPGHWRIAHNNSLQCKIYLFENDCSRTKKRPRERKSAKRLMDVVPGLSALLRRILFPVKPANDRSLKVSFFHARESRSGDEMQDFHQLNDVESVWSSWLSTKFLCSRLEATVWDVNRYQTTSDRDKQ